MCSHGAGCPCSHGADANDNSAISWAISCPRNANGNSDGFISTGNANDNSDGILSTYNADDNSNGLNSDLNAGSLIATSDNPRSHGTSGTGARYRDDAPEVAAEVARLEMEADVLLTQAAQLRAGTATLASRASSGRMVPDYDPDGRDGWEFAALL